ncbi:MAG: Holliday junction resolvase RuvX [Acidimicrobiia bacterium]
MTRILGVDYGTKRVGLAISDGLALTANPLEVVPRDSAVARVISLIGEYAVEIVVIGLPTGLSGGEGLSAEGARALGEEIGAACPVSIEFVDERFTSRMADEALLESGMKRRERRDTVDKVAAAIILQAYLDQRGRGNSKPI